MANYTQITRLSPAQRTKGTNNLTRLTLIDDSTLRNQIPKVTQPPSSQTVNNQFNELLSIQEASVESVPAEEHAKIKLIDESSKSTTDEKNDANTNSKNEIKPIFYLGF